MLTAYRRDGSPVHAGDTITSAQGDGVVFERAAYLSADASKSKIITRNDRGLIVHSYACLYGLTVADDAPAPAASPPVPDRVTPRPEHDSFALPPGYHGKPSGSRGITARAGTWFDNQTTAVKVVLAVAPYAAR
jgi:hypothetical protein